MKTTCKLILALYLPCGPVSLFAQPSDSTDTGHYIVAYDHTVRTSDAAGNPVEDVCRLTDICGSHVPYPCAYYGQPCAIPATGGFNTGTCKWTDKSLTEKKLTCVIDA